MSNATILHIGTLHAKAEHIDNLIQSFEGLKQAEGYISHVCYRDIEDQNKLTLVEEWEAKSDHQNFVNSFSQQEMDQWLNMLSQQGDDSYYKKL